MTFLNLNPLWKKVKKVKNKYHYISQVNASSDDWE